MWKKPGDELKQKNLCVTVKYDGEKGFCVWGCMRACEKGKLEFFDGIMGHIVYLYILKNNLKVLTFWAYDLH